MYASTPPGTVVYNNVAFSPVHARQTMVLSTTAQEAWRTVGQFDKQARWMGTVEGQNIFTQLLGGQTADFVGAVRVFGIADKLIFEQLTRLDQEEMHMCWQGISHPMNSNPFPASFLNFKASLRLIPISIPGGQTLIEWTMDLLTETHAVEYMAESMNGILRVGLHNLQAYLAAGAAPSRSLDMAVRAPSSYGITAMPQPQSAGLMLSNALRSDAGGQPLYQQASASYMPPPVQQAPILSAEVVARGAGSGPAEAQPRKQGDGSALRGAVQSARQAAAGVPSLLHPISGLAAPSPAALLQQQGRRSPAGKRQGFRPGLPPLSEHPPNHPQGSAGDDGEGTSPEHASEGAVLEHGLGSGLSLDSMSLGEVRRIQPREDGSLPRRSAAMQLKLPAEGAG